MNIKDMTPDEFRDFCNSITNTKGKVLSFLKKLNKGAEVFIYDKYEKKYTNIFEIWTEGHDTRHFIEFSSYGKCSPMTVRRLIKELSDSYKEKGSKYANSVMVNVANLKGNSTANFDYTMRNGDLYLTGKKPLYEYYAEYRNAKIAS